MGLWDEVEDLDIDVEKSPNKYLSNKENAMNLIGRILAFNNEDNNLRRSIFKLHNLIEEDLLNITSRVNVEEETKLYNELKHIKDKLYADKEVLFGIPILLLPSCVKLVKKIELFEP